MDIFFKKAFGQCHSATSYVFSGGIWQYPYHLVPALQSAADCSTPTTYGYMD